MAGSSKSGQVYRELLKVQGLVSRGFTNVKENSRILRQCQGTREKGAIMVLERSKEKEDFLFDEIRKSACTLDEQTIRNALKICDNNMGDATVMLCQEMRDRMGLEEELEQRRDQGGSYIAPSDVSL